MKLSDAIALGRTILKPTAGGSSRDPSMGCALQLALVAVGRADAAFPEDSMGLNYAVAEGLWGRGLVNQVWSAFDSIGYRDLNFFIQWVRSIESADEPGPTDALAAEEARIEVCDE
jgi:hypothetical protein